MSHLSPSSIEALGKAYPDRPAALKHDLAGHELLQLDALAEAALRMKPEKVDRRLANSGGADEGGFPRAGDDGKMADQVIRGVAESGNWVGLCNLELLPDYRALLEEIMAEIAPVMEPRTGRCLDMVGFIFISPPGTFTPYHFDAEYNILFHISGSKQFATFPISPQFLQPELQEAYHANGNNVLPWRDDFAQAEQLYPLEPGDALYVPFSMPHWVRVGSKPCISLSITWQSKWSQRTCNALRLNHALRQRGLATYAPPAWPQSARWRSTFYRAAHKVGLV